MKKVWLVYEIVLPHDIGLRSERTIIRAFMDKDQAEKFQIDKGLYSSSRIKYEVVGIDVVE